MAIIMAVIIRLNACPAADVVRVISYLVIPLARPSGRYGLYTR